MTRFFAGVFGVGVGEKQTTTKATAIDWSFRPLGFTPASEEWRPLCGWLLLPGLKPGPNPRSNGNSAEFVVEKGRAVWRATFRKPLGI